MPRLGSLAFLSLLAACGSHPSKLDDVKKASPAGDPWGLTGEAKDVKDGEDAEDGGPLDGVDLKDLLEKLKDNIDKQGPYEAPEKSADFDVEKPFWAVWNFGGDVVEKKTYSITGGKGSELREIVSRFRDLAKNEKLVGILLRVGGDLSISVPDLVELRLALAELKAAGKQLSCFTENVDDAGYMLMTACSKIGIAPLGNVAILGPSATPIHLKPLLDRFGVTADFLHVGAYKGAAEPLTRDAPSPEMQETLGAILDGRYATLVDVIAKDRKLDPAAVKGLVDVGLFASEKAKAAKLVDEVASFETFRDGVIGKTPWTEIELQKKGGQTDTLLGLMRFIGAVPVERPTDPHVAVVYAIGDIENGGENGVVGAREKIAGDTLVAALRALGKDDSVKSVVLRIDSGGGSAQASELIWQAVEELNAKKPVVVSMSDVAASGGYYIASGADKIYAMPDTLTGSIGVVGGRIALGPALAKQGVNAFPMGRGKNATMMSAMKTWTADEKAVIQQSMEEVYDVFVGRVAAGRKKKLEDVKAMAQGRVWTGVKAKELGLVDELGGLDDAIAEARKLGKVDAAAGLEVYPSTPTLRDFLAGYGAVHAPIAATAMDAIAQIDPQMAASVQRLLDLALSFRATAIQTIAVIPEIR